MIYSHGASVLEEKTKMPGTLRQLWVAFLLYLGWNPGTKDLGLVVRQLTPHLHFLQLTADRNRQPEPP